MTVRRSLRLRPLSWLRANPSGAAVAEIIWICWCKVGWLPLTWTIRSMLAAAAASNVFLAVQGVERDDGAAGEAEFAQQRLRRRNLVGFPGDVGVGEHQCRVGGEGAEHLGGGAVMEPIEAAAQGLAVERDAALSRHGARRLQQGGMASERSFHLNRIEPLQDLADGGARRQFRPKAAFSLRRCTSTKVTMPQYELQPATMARMENSSTWGSP